MTQKHIRQYIGLFSAITVYYLIHEGAHFLCAILFGTFKTVRFMGLGIQIDVYAETMTDLRMGIFCIVGSVATAAAAYLLVLCSDRICKHPSALFRACLYYITLAMLLVDPLYLGILFRFFGGGDMNGISLLFPQSIAQIIYVILLVIHGLLFWKIILPKYRT